MEPMYLSIQPVETGKRIKQLLSEQNYTIRTHPGQLYHSQQIITYQH